MVRACMASVGFNDDVAADRSSLIISEVYRATPSVHIQPHATKLQQKSDDLKKKISTSYSKLFSR